MSPKSPGKPTITANRDGSKTVKIQGRQITLQPNQQIVVGSIDMNNIHLVAVKDATDAEILESVEARIKAEAAEDE